MYTREQIAGAIDHTLLKTTATQQDILKICAEARDLGLFAVCVPPCYVAIAAAALEGSHVRVAAVIGFPHGYNETEVKAFEAAEAVRAGAAEVDMVVNIGAVKAGDWTYVERDIARVVEEARRSGAARGTRPLVKVIIETAALTDDEKRSACLAAKRACADYVKTSTGFGGGGATEADVRLMRETVGPGMGVKASGGVRTLDQAIAMLQAGATRIGTSNGGAIVREFDERVRSNGRGEDKF
ncbi:MAG: deoxyribose-phosphate aldolase [Bacillota bacterium]|nr:deoxyribose-phosphate aldolase [Bacillota bacterium]